MKLGSENHPNFNTSASPSALVIEPDNVLGVTPSIHWNDAVVYGDLHSEDAQKVLDSELVTGFSPHAPKVAGDKWIQKKFRLRDGMEALTRHPVQKIKEGTAQFFVTARLMPPA
ncbi:MAG: hypothetical protein ABJG14_17110 [Sulfitobacter sp.]|uniref:hypothetical protein n=1 Tax=Alphaproteobacteria TaxID=28211 RepID=UPI0032645CDA